VGSSPITSTIVSASEGPVVKNGRFEGELVGRTRPDRGTRIGRPQTAATGAEVTQIPAIPRCARSSEYAFTDRSIWACSTLPATEVRAA
jgi:hypothetical protein